ncbi:MAG: nicotinamide-nucleotide amidohydrolase family protein [Rhodobacteraceae bacterium]|nr:nicotinamide-nucleotide amidohydrolase family protein [Paracoccaceae bacterium]
MSLAAEVISAARAAGLKISTAESCTGGMLAAALTDISGASAVFDRGFITYSYASKPEMLGITPETLDAHGAVSAEAVAQMAAGALANSDADIAVAITGIAGPLIGSTKPEGLVWFAMATASGVKTTMQEFGAIGRANVRQASVEKALNLLLSAIKR